MAKKTSEQMHAEEFEDIEKSKFNRIPASTSTYRANCKNWDAGYKFTSEGNAKGQSAFHHIICIHSIQNEHIKPNDKLDFFRKCMVLTDWDINDGHNLISLPTKWVLYQSDLKNAANLNPDCWQFEFSFAYEIDGKAGKFGAVPNLPCHWYHHEAYRQGVTDYLENEVWKPLGEKKDLKECQKVDGKSIEAELKRVSDYWRNFLTTRGESHGGAAYCWRKRFDEPMWYFPLSMHPGTPPKVLPPPYWRKSRSKNQNLWMEKMFKTIV